MSSLAIGLIVIETDQYWSSSSCYHVLMLRAWIGWIHSESVYLQTWWLITGWPRSQVARGFVFILAIHPGETARRKTRVECYNRKTGRRRGWKVGDFRVAKKKYLYSWLAVEEIKPKEEMTSKLTITKQNNRDYLIAVSHFLFSIFEGLAMIIFSGYRCSSDTKPLWPAHSLAIQVD